MNKKSFAYFGTPYVARDTLASLLLGGYRPVVVVTSPDAPRGRGLHLTPSETRVLAEEHGIPVLAPEKLTTEVLSEVLSYEPSYAIVVAYGKILPKAFIEAFPDGVLNIHYSLLPKFRGASPVEAALLHGDAVTGVTIQQMVYELDAGDILAQEEVVIGDTETTKELRPRLIRMGSDLLIRTLPSFEAGEVTAVTQNAELATFAPKIAKSEGELSIPGDDESNWRKYRAFKESPGTHFYTQNPRIRVKINEARYQDGVFTPLRVTPEGKREMTFDEFMRFAGNGS